MFRLCQANEGRFSKSFSIVFTLLNVRLGVFRRKKKIKIKKYKKYRITREFRKKNEKIIKINYKKKLNDTRKNYIKIRVFKKKS